MNLRVKTVVFDLDGTIYQNTTFHHDYFHFLVEGTERESWEAPLIEFAEEIFAGRRLVMNRFYATKLIAAESPECFFTALEQQLHPPISYEEALEQTGLLYLGDAWAVVTLIGETLGLLENGRDDEVYRRTRRKMEQNGMLGDLNLKAAIIDLTRRYRVVLMSNSYEGTVREFLRQLGYENIFPKICSSANKPVDMLRNLQKLEPDILEHPDKVLTVGDNAYNDLMPLASRGARTVWINPFPNIARPICDVELSTLEQVAEYLSSL